MKRIHLSILLKEEMVINHADKYLGEVHSKQRKKV